MEKSKSKYKPSLKQMGFIFLKSIIGTLTA
jgi:hypothetical protein